MNEDALDVAGTKPMMYDELLGIFHSVKDAIIETGLTIAKITVSIQEEGAVISDKARDNVRTLLATASKDTREMIVELEEIYEEHKELSGAIPIESYGEALSISDRYFTLNEKFTRVVLPALADISLLLNTETSNEEKENESE